VQVVRQSLKQVRNSLFATIALLKIKLKSSPPLVILTYHPTLSGRSLQWQAHKINMIITPKTLEMQND